MLGCIMDIMHKNLKKKRNHFGHTHEKRKLCMSIGSHVEKACLFMDVRA